MGRRPGRRRSWAKSRRWTAALALEVLDALGQSGLGLREFAELEGISAQRLARWQQRLGADSDSAPSFVELTPRGRDEHGDDRGCVFEIVLGSGRLVRVPSDFDDATLRRLIVVLEERPC